MRYGTLRNVAQRMNPQPAISFAGCTCDGQQVAVLALVLVHEPDDGPEPHRHHIYPARSNSGRFRYRLMWVLACLRACPSHC
jgi:hypothetical protein